MVRILATIAAFALLLPSGAIAHDHRPPKVFLRVAGVGQQGSPQSYCWRYPPNPDGTQVRECNDIAALGVGDGLAVPMGRRARIRFWDRDKPKKVRIRGWEDADESGTPLGPSTLFRRRLRPIWRDGRLKGWVAIFRLPKHTGDLFLTAKADYTKPDSGGVMYWDFHLDLY